MFRSPFRVWSSLVVIVGGYLTLAMGQPRQTQPGPFELREAAGKPGSILLPQGLETGAAVGAVPWSSPFGLGPIAQGAGGAPVAGPKSSQPTTSAPASSTKASQPPTPQAKPVQVLTMDMVLSRETPRKLLETFYFAIEGAEFKPDLLQTAVQCLDNNAFQGDPATLGLTAVHLGEILDHFDVSHLAGPERATGNTVVILKEGEFTIALRHVPGDG